MAKDRGITVNGVYIPAEVVTAARVWCCNSGGGFRYGDFTSFLSRAAVPYRELNDAADRMLQRFRASGVIAYHGGRWWPVERPAEPARSAAA